MRSTKSPSSTRPGGLSWWQKALGFEPVPAPPHVFGLDARSLRYGQFVRDRQGFRLRGWRESALPSDAFHAGLLGGPLRDPVAFEALVGGLVRGVPGGLKEAALVLPDAWLRVTFSEITDVPRQAQARDDVLRWKLRRLVPFRVDELRVSAVEVEPLPVQEEPRRLLMGFGVEQLLAQIEDAFAAHGVRLGRITNSSLALLSAVELPASSGFAAVVQVETEGYTLIFARNGEPVLHRFKPFTGGGIGGGDAAHAGYVTRDLKLTRNFLDENFAGAPLGQVLLLAPPAAEPMWLDRLQEGLGSSVAPVDGRHLPSLRSEDPVAPSWRELAPMLGAVRQEVA
ncbi:MAG: hypothetical protein ABUT39_09425 [Acidobacteriota bacterium]